MQFKQLQHNGLLLLTETNTNHFFLQ